MKSTHETTAGAAAAAPVLPLQLLQPLDATHPLSTPASTGGPEQRLIVTPDPGVGMELDLRPTRLLAGALPLWCIGRCLSSMRSASRSTTSTPKLATDTLMAPWTIINSNEKRRARLGAIRSVLHALDYKHKDHDIVGEPDPRGRAHGTFGVHRQLIERFLVQLHQLLA
jgi:hypothetical protein